LAPAYDLVTTSMSKPVFYDPDRTRWKRLRVLLDIVGVVITIVVIVFVVSTVSSETLPSLLLPDQRRPYHALKEKEKASRRAAVRKNATATVKAANPNAKVGTTDNGVRAAFYVQWDAGSFSSLKEYYPQID